MESIVAIRSLTEAWQRDSNKRRRLKLTASPKDIESLFTRGVVKTIIGLIEKFRSLSELVLYCFFRDGILQTFEQAYVIEVLKRPEATLFVS